jgi:hypothetical protein
MSDDMSHAHLAEGMKQPLQKALRGAVFPLSRSQLLLLARENEAPAVVLSLLSTLPEHRFESLASVERGLEAQTGKGEREAEPSQPPMHPR